MFASADALRAVHGAPAPTLGPLGPESAFILGVVANKAS